MDISGNVLILPMLLILLYFVLEAGEWGLLLSGPWTARTKQEQAALLNLCRPGLDGNELWLFSGAYLLYELIPRVSHFGGTTCFTIFAALAVIGMLLRTIGGWLKQSAGSSAFIRVNALISLFTLIFFGLSLGTLLSGINEGSLTHLGIIFALWMIVAAFQGGTLWGAVKIENPLAERLRASFLVSSLISIILFVILGIMMYLESDASSVYLVCFILSLILNIVSYVLARKRSVAGGLGAFIVSLVLACAFILEESLSLIASEFAVQEIGEAIPVIVLVIAALWSAASLIYRLVRPKIKYAWEDHI